MQRLQVGVRGQQIVAHGFTVGEVHPSVRSPATTPELMKRYSSQHHS
jgi:hypothetical protein